MFAVTSTANGKQTTTPQPAAGSICSAAVASAAACSRSPMRSTTSAYCAVSSARQVGTPRSTASATRSAHQRAASCTSSACTSANSEAAMISTVESSSRQLCRISVASRAICSDGPS